MNGAVMKNFITEDTPFASSVVGTSDFFVSEVDESDGSIAQFSPKIAVLNNIALDHKSMDELRILFRDFVGKSKAAVLNLDNAETAALAGVTKSVTYSLEDTGADLFASGFRAATRRHRVRPARARKPRGDENAPSGSGPAQCRECAGGDCGRARMRRGAQGRGPGAGAFQRNQAPARNRGTADGVTVIDDFAHNPDKIAASLATLHDFPGRLLVMFQPHGFGPLKLMKDDFIACFAREPDRGRRADHARAGVFRRHGRSQRHDRGYRGGRSGGRPRRVTASRIEPPAASSYWSWRSPATASW